MAKITFQMICFNADAFLEAALKSIVPFGDVVVTEGPVDYYQRLGYTESTDNTRAILEKYIPKKMRVHGQFAEKDEMMHASEHLIPKDTTHVWMVDADEIYTSELIRTVRESLDDYDSVSFKPYTFYGGWDDYLTGFEEEFEWLRVQRWRADAHWHTHRPPTVLDEYGTPYRLRRQLHCTERFYHYSYVMPLSVKAKIDYYASWNAGVIPNYFERVYLPWVNSHTSEARQSIEKMYNGVHEWLPRRRSACFTTNFRGQHPKVIREQLALLETRRRDELADATNAIDARQLQRQEY